MSYPSLRLALVAGLVLPLSLAGASFAQDGAASSPSGVAGQERPMERHRDPAEMRARMGEHLRKILRLQPSQDAALNTFLDAMKPAGAMRDGEGDRGGADRDQMQRMTTPERLERLAQRMDEQRARLTGLIILHQQWIGTCACARAITS